MPFQHICNHVNVPFSNSIYHTVIQYHNLHIHGSNLFVHPLNLHVFYSHSENDLFLKSSCLKIDLFSIQVSFNFLNFAIFYQPTHVLTTESEMANKQSFNSSLTVLFFFFYISIFFQIGKD